MTAQSLLQTITSRGASIRVVGDRLRIKPDNVLTDADRASIRALKPELLAALDTHQAALNTSPETGNSGKPREVSEADRLRYRAGKDFAAGRIDVDGLADVLAEAEWMESRPEFDRTHETIDEDGTRTFDAGRAYKATSENRNQDSTEVTP